MADDEPWILNTQNTLGAYVKNPKLTAKLLSRPPFRFLHDVVSAFVKSTNSLNGLYSSDELDAGKAGADKESKLKFLDKLVTCIQYATGETLNVKPILIIAGKEPQETNQMLAHLAKIPKLPPAAVNEAIAKTTGASPQSIPQSAEGGARTPRREDASRGRSRGQDGKQHKDDAANNNQQQEEAEKQNKKQDNSKPTERGPIQRPGTATARKPPPSLRNNEVVEDRSALESAQPVAGVIVEKKNDEDDEDNNNNNNNKKSNNKNSSSNNPESQQDWMKLVEQHENATSVSKQNIGEGGAKGYLASEALQAKKEQEEAARRAKEEADGNRQEGVVLHYKGKGGDNSGSVGDSEISKLREQLQLLTKASNPLGKYLEAIFDDIDSMTRELDMWRNEARTQTTAATEAQRQTQESLREVNAQLSGLEESINDQTQKVSVVRAQIQKNEATVEKLIRMVINPNEGKR